MSNWSATLLKLMRLKTLAPSSTRSSLSPLSRSMKMALVSRKSVVANTGPRFWSREAPNGVAKLLSSPCWGCRVRGLMMFSKLGVRTVKGSPLWTVTTGASAMSASARFRKLPSLVLKGVV